MFPTCGSAPHHFRLEWAPVTAPVLTVSEIYTWVSEAEAQSYLYTNCQLVQRVTHTIINQYLTACIFHYMYSDNVCVCNLLGRIFPPPHSCICAMRALIVLLW